MSIRYPMEHGIVKDWNDMERIWQYIYSKDQLQTFSEEVIYIIEAFMYCISPVMWILGIRNKKTKEYSLDLVLI